MNTPKWHLSPAHTATAERVLCAVGGMLVAVVAVSLPWELYQQTPFRGMTLTKLAGSAAIPVAVALTFLRRARAIPKTSLEAPIVLFALMCAVSIAFSLDPAVSARQFISYVTYLAFLGAMVVLVRDATSARFHAALYTLSASGMAALTLLCAAGAAWPMRWGTASWAVQRLILEYRDGVAMRMTAASGDFNLAALELLVAFAAALYLFYGTKLRFITRLGLHALQIVLFAAIVVTMSRSGILIAAALCVPLALATVHSRARWWPAGLVLLAILVGVAVWQHDFVSILVDRARGGIVRDDGSVRGRWQVFQIGFALLPEYWLKGCGLGAVDAAMSRSPYADQAVMTLHSMPFKIVLELGVVGLAAYLWIWAAAAYQAFRRLVRDSDAKTRGLGAAFLAMLAACFLLTAIQPFPALSLYPFVLGLGLGPIAARLRRESGEKEPVPARRGLAGLVAVAVSAAVIAPNIANYQRSAARVERFGDALSEGIEAESVGDWASAAKAYALAGQYAQPIADF
ncbi:MAG: O-antigen ligase family protein, partial [Candidatus Hydrogenedentes bacterium]|nr:O-antigen ligase family protein [Candidatus Hydrogenedentota bacterium]